MMIRLLTPKDCGQLWTMLSCIQPLANLYNLSFEVTKVIQILYYYAIRFFLNYIIPYGLNCDLYDINYSDEYQYDIPDTITPIDTHEGPGGLPVQILNAHVKPTTSIIQRKCSIIGLIIHTVS